VHCSPFHLARQFRAATGQTIARHLLRLRLSLALERIAAGETSLARLASDLGFAHHSHLTARFHAMFATTPSQLRTILTAHQRSAS
jgi:AraC family transcriptional regulator